MSKNETKKIQTGKVIRAIIFLTIFIYFVLRSIPNFLSTSSKTVYPERQIVGDNYPTRAIIIRNEELYKSAGRGSVKYSVKEGERVPSGKHIAKLKLTGNTSTHGQKLEEINKKIEILEKSKSDIEKGKVSKTGEADIDNLIRDIQKSLQESDYERAEVLKEKLSIYEGKTGDVVGNRALIDENLNKLKLERNKISNELNESTINYYAKDAGIVSFKVDGYEEVYKFSDRAKYKFTDFDEKPMKKNLLDNKLYDSNEPIFKIISNYEWYMVIDASNIKDIDKLKKGNNIRIANKDKELIGTIEHKQKNKNDVTILCKFNTDFEEFYDKRFVDIDVIRYKYEGYKIPKRAIVEKNNQKGVFVKDISGITKFRPVNILFEEDDQLYVDVGDDQNNILVGPDDEPVRTITKFDEVILNTKSVKEGTISNQ